MTASPETPAEKTPDGSGGRGLGGAVAAMFSGTLVSRVLGFLRAAIIGVALGVAGGATDAFALANNLPNTIYMLIAGGVINAVLVPQLVRAAKDPDGGRSYTNRLLTVGGVGLLAITAILTVAAPLLILMYGSRLGSGWLPIAYAFAYWCIPQIFFYGLYTLLGQVLNAKSVFGPYMWAPVLNNVVALAGLFVYLRIFGAMPTPILSPADFGTDRILLLGVTATLGVALQALILVVPLWRSGFRYRPEWGLKGLRTAGTMGGWTFGALLVGQVGVLAISNVAAAASAQSDLDKIPYAGNYAYGLAFTVFMLPQSLVVVSLITAMFTRLSKHASDRDRSAVRAAMSLSVRSSGVFTMLATVAMVALALPLATLVTLGQQRESAVDQIAGLIVALALGIPGLALWSVVQRVYFAYQDARSPFWIQVPMMLIVVAGVVVSRFATRPNGWVFGACLAMSLSYTVGGLVGYLGLRRRLVHLDGSRIFSTYFRLALAAGPALVAGFGTVVLLQHLLPGRGLLTAIVETGIGGAVVVGIYFGLAHVLKVKEIQIATMRLRGILTRLLRPVTGRLRTMGGGRGAAAENVTGESWVLDDAVTSGMLLADRFRVESGLSSTMTGVRAWRGRDTILERDVDILSVGGPRGEDILDGARRASLITDPRVPRVLRVGEHDRSGYIVLEPAPGTTLADLLAAGSLSEPAARSIVGEVASALEAARRRGVHHLALGPTFVAIDDDGGVHVTGLGVAAAASGRSLSPAESAQADADAAVALYPLLSGKPLPPEAERDLPTPSNVVVAFAPWSSVPPLEELLTYVTSAPRDEDEDDGGASGPEDPDDGDDDGPIDGGAVEDGTDEAAGDEAGDAGADEPIETGQAATDDAEGTTATAEDEAVDDEAVENEAVGEELVQEAVATGGAVLGAASDLSTPIIQDEGDEVADDETDTSAQGPAEATRPIETRPIETTTPIETAGSETAPTKTDDSGTSGSEELGSDETGSGEPASGATAPGVTGATAVSTGLGAVRSFLRRLDAIIPSERAVAAPPALASPEVPVAPAAASSAATGETSAEQEAAEPTTVLPQAIAPATIAVPAPPVEGSAPPVEGSAPPVEGSAPPVEGSAPTGSSASSSSMAFAGSRPTNAAPASTVPPASTTQSVTSTTTPGTPGPAQPAPVLDPAYWQVRAPESFTPPPWFGDVVDPAGHGSYTPEDDVSVSASPPDGVTSARHVSGAAMGALGAWWEGRRELFEKAREERRTEAAARAEAEAAARAEAAAAAEAAAEAAAAEEAALEEQRVLAETEYEAATALGATEAASSTGTDETFLEPAPVAQPDESSATHAIPVRTSIVRPTSRPPVPRTAAGAATAHSAVAETDQAALDAERYVVPGGRPRTWGTINATPIVLGLVLVGVLYVAYLAISSLIAPLREGVLPDLNPEPSAPSAPVDPTGEPTDGGEAPPEGEQAEDPPADATGYGPADLPDLSGMSEV